MKALIDKSSRHILVGFAGIIALSLGVAVIALQERERDRLAAEHKTLQHAIDVLEEAPGEVLKMYYETRGNGFPAKNESAWAHVHATALLKSKRIAELAEIYRRNPELIQNEETLSIPVYQFLSSTGRYEAANALRDHWRDRETDQLGWLNAAVIVYVHVDELARARSIAMSAELAAEDEVYRQLLLAQLSDQPAARIEHLDAALALQPFEPDVRHARGLQLESDNQIRYALYEYKQALKADPGNPERAHALAGFLVRNRQSRAALDIWETWAEKDQQAYIRAALWSRLIRPMQATPNVPRVIEPDLELIVAALASHAEPFFDSSLLDGLVDLEEVFWITLLNKISTARYADALAQMHALQLDSSTLNPVIFDGFYQVLNFRVHNKLDSQTSPLTLALKPSQLPFITRQLGRLQSVNENAEGERETNQAVRALLNSDQIFTAIALAGGWTEAALNLPKPTATSPRWLQLQWVAALSANRSAKRSLAYVESLQPWDQQIQVIAAELYLKTGRVVDGESILRQHATSGTMAGMRAAHLYARLQLERKAYNPALEAIIANPSFSMTVAGHELVARVYIAAGANERALAVLSRIIENSTFAREFIAIEAYQSGDYKNASDNLAALILDQPERGDLRVSLLQVAKAQQKAEIQ
ncbi:MAG: thioredoxin-like negative regulator of GroEL [Candidatus Azotimanducaceae bacterium]